MAGHSQFKNIMYRKGAQDAKRAKVFAKIGREIAVAAKGNPDPETNPRLRAAIAEAKANNMPKDNVDRALKKAAGGTDDDNYEEMRYEGYGPSGVAVIVDALTDNRNRTASDVRAAFAKHGGNLGESNSVLFMFDRMGSFTYDETLGDEDKVFEIALEVGAEDVKPFDGGYQILCQGDQFHSVRDALEAQVGAPQSSGLEWIAKTPTAITDVETAQKLMRLIDTLEDNDDVQRVSTNMDLADDVLNALKEA